MVTSEIITANIFSVVFARFIATNYGRPLVSILSDNKNAVDFARNLSRNSDLHIRCTDLQQVHQDDLNVAVFPVEGFQARSNETLLFSLASKVVPERFVLILYGFHEDPKEFIRLNVQGIPLKLHFFIAWLQDQDIYWIRVAKIQDEDKVIIGLNLSENTMVFVRQTCV